MKSKVTFIRNIIASLIRYLAHENKKHHSQCENANPTGQLDCMLNIHCNGIFTDKGINMRLQLQSLRIYHRNNNRVNGEDMWLLIMRHGMPREIVRIFIEHLAAKIKRTYIDQRDFREKPVPSRCPWPLIGY